MKYIAQIDKDKLRKLKYKVVTQDVILTEERLEHVRKRHLEDCKKYLEYLPDIIENPDYILEDSKNADTILVLKTIIKFNENVQVVIKLQTRNGNGFNSIITFWKMRNRSYKTILRNNKIIYENIDIKV